MSSPQSAPNFAPAPQEIVMQAGLAYIVSSCLGVAVKLGVPDLIETEGTTLGLLAERTKTKKDFLYRVLRVLEMAGIVSQPEAGKFALTAAGALLRSDANGSLHDIIEFMTDPLHFQLYSGLRSSIETGATTFEHMFGEPFFSWTTHAENADETAVFYRAMTSFSNMCIPAFLEAYDFSAFKVLVDVGAGHGAIIRAVLNAHPSLKGVIADMPSVMAGAREAIARDRLADRCSVEPCDFFVSVPAGGDGYFMKHILHDWADDQAVAILKNIRKVIATNGKLLLGEAVIESGPAPHPGKLIDIEMIAFVGGKERTEPEFRDLLSRGGFKLNRVIPTKSPLSLIEASPV